MASEEKTTMSTIVPTDWFELRFAIIWKFWDKIILFIENLIKGKN